LLEEAGWELQTKEGGWLWQYPGSLHVTIPRLLHLFPDSVAPDLRAIVVRSWQREHQPRGWEVRCWTEAELRQLVNDETPSFLGTYLSYPTAEERWGAARFFILRAHGGVVVTGAALGLRPLDDLLPKITAFAALEPGRRRKAAALLSDTLVGSEKNHPIWHCLEQDLEQRVWNEYRACVGSRFLHERFRDASRFISREKWPRVLSAKTIAPCEIETPEGDGIAEDPWKRLAQLFPDCSTIPWEQVPPEIAAALGTKSGPSAPAIGRKAGASKKGVLLRTWRPEDISLVVMTAPRKAPYLFQTLESLFRSGSSVRQLGELVIAADEVELNWLRDLPHREAWRVVPLTEREAEQDKDFWMHRRAARTFVRCLRSASARTRGVMVCEDDLIFAPGFVERLLACLNQMEASRVHQGILAVYSLHHHPATTEKGAERTFRRYEDSAFYGCQCMLYPRRWVLPLVRYVEQHGVESPRAPFDLLVGEFCQERRNLYAIQPSLVQHAGDFSTGLGVDTALRRSRIG
jgi:hypothetical protein